ncbi:methyl-CpG-binding domain-containing protein 13-like isoform X2 [Argentina anserina]|uniref:methyl-CpG-binding domain-containing protein 13-like isoform X2 n=1 Tax=Argentina anserina TaxID=57926 RepID=UPI0021764DCB|nr:methyl-CpG-binding domain-containing protein 13-like isoform X2 [Potentilla anserina]
MMAASSPDWLPAGWTVQFRAQNRGRSSVIYIDLETGKKLYSKDDVIRYAKKATDGGEQPWPTDTKSPSNKSHSQLAANRDEYPEWLPNGWKVELRTRQSGVQAGREYKCYIDPSTQCTFYSKPEVFRHLRTVKCKSCKSRSHKMVVVEKHNVEDLPPGWILEIKVRKVSNRIRRDPYYTDPVHGYVFRSKKDVIRYLQTGKTSKHTIKPKGICTNDPKLTEDEIALSSATKRRKLENPVTRRQHAEAKRSSELSGLDLQEIKSSKLQEKRPTEIVCALASITAVFPKKQSTENLVEECVETKGECSPSGSSHPKAEASSKHVGKRSSQRLAALSNKHEAKRSKLQDKKVDVASAPTAEAIPHKHLSEIVVVNCSKTKDDYSPIKLLQPNAKISNKCEEKTALNDGSLSDPGKVIISEDDPALTPAANSLDKENSHMSRIERSSSGRSQTDGRRSRKKENLNLPRRSSKRLAGLEPEPVKSLVSTVKALQVATRKSCKGDGSPDAGLASDYFVNIASQQLGDTSETQVAHHTMTKIISTVQEESVSKVKRTFDGLELPADSLFSSEQTLHFAPRKTSEGDGSRDVGLASDVCINAVMMPDIASEPEAAHGTFTDTNSTSQGESLNKGKTTLDDEAVPKEQHHKLEPETMNPEKPGPELCFLFGSDPCLEFAFKTLTGELPIAEAENNEPIMKHASDMVPKENSLETGSCSSKTRAISNKSKNAKQLKLPCRTSKRLAGVEPELLVKPMSSERGLQNAKAKSCRCKTLPAVDSAHEASQQFQAGQENKVALATCTILDPSLHEEPSKKIEKSLNDQVVPEDKPQKLETEKAAVENPVSQFSFPFLDTWSDPCLEFAFKTLTGEIPISDDFFQGYFQENLVTSHNQRDSSTLPDFGSPNFFQSDVSPQFNAPEQSILGRFPTNTSLPPAGNVSLPDCNGVGFGQQLSMSSSFLPVGNMRISSGNGVGSSQHSSVNSSFAPAGNVGVPNWSRVGTQNPCIGAKKDFHGKVKS